MEWYYPLCNSCFLFTFFFIKLNGHFSLLNGHFKVNNSIQYTMSYTKEFVYYSGEKYSTMNSTIVSLISVKVGIKSGFGVISAPSS